MSDKYLSVARMRHSQHKLHDRARLVTELDDLSRSPETNFVG